MDNKLSVQCSNCGKRYTVTNPAVPKSYRCKNCNAIIIVEPYGSQRSPPVKIETPVKTEDPNKYCPRCIHFKKETLSCAKYAFIIKNNRQLFFQYCNGKGLETLYDKISAPTPGVEASENETPYFFTTSTLKFALMSLCTFGIYDLYWFYQNWSFIKKRTGQNLSPFWRSWFAPFWAYSCFDHIHKTARENEIHESSSLSVFSVFYLLLKVSYRLPDPYWLIALFSFTMIIPVNNIALKINKKVVPNFKNNENFSAWNWVAMFFGGIILLLAIVGTLSPET